MTSSFPQSTTHSAGGERARQQTRSFINQPITFTRGAYAPRTIRTVLVEEQQPDLGRKFANRDRRPLDPPPVLRLHMVEVLHPGTEHQTEQSYTPDLTQTCGLIAFVDLFAVAAPLSQSALRTGTLPSPSSPRTPRQRKSQQREPMLSTNQGAPRQPPQLLHGPDSPQTENLFGATFVNANHIQDPTGQEAVYFVWSDISVRQEGYFVLRYRLFDVTSYIADTEDTPILAETYSGVFKIYSTKEFPGLDASTELTKHLSRFGIRVNLRESERKKRGRVSGERDQQEESSQSPNSQTQGPSGSHQYDEYSGGLV